MKTRTIVLMIVVPLVLIIIAVPVIIVAVAFGAVYFGSKSTEEFTCAMKLVRENEEVKAALGDNIQDGYLIIPNVSIENSRRTVDMKVPVSGSLNSASMFITSYRDNFRNDYSVWVEHNSKQIRIHKGTFPCTE